MSYLAKQVGDILGKSSGYIAQVGQVIKPDNEAHGRGHRSLYSFRNIAEIAIYIVLNGFGVPRKQIAEHIENLRSSRFRWLEEDGTDGWIGLGADWKWGAGPTPNHIIDTLWQSGPVKGIITINLSEIKNHIRTKLELPTREDY